MKIVFRSRIWRIRQAWMVLSLLLVCSPTARAGTNGFIVPIFRGTTGSQFGLWEVFTSAAGGAGNRPDSSSATAQTLLWQTDTNAFLTGSGNIYNLSTSAFELTNSAPSALGTVVLQARTVGSQLDYSSVSLIYSNASGLGSLAPLYRYELDHALEQGDSVSSLWQWNLTGLSVTLFKVVFQAAGPSLSFDSMTLDTSSSFTPVFPQQPYRLESVPSELARWMYPFNANPASRPAASVFGSLGSTPDFDSRDAQFLLGWNTTNRVPSGQGVTNYLIRRARVRLTIASGDQYVYTGTVRDYRSYFPTNDPCYVASANPGSPVELFGAGFRGGFTAATFPQDGPWGVVPEDVYFTNRTVYAAGYDQHGVLVDVSNNVGDDGTNEISGAFEVAPFAVGQSTNIAPGERMPAGSQLAFDLNLEDPLIYGYLQEGLNDGNLRFVVTSFVGASLAGPPTYPNFFTPFSPIATPGQYPILDLEGAIVRPGVDTDADGLNDDWENFYFGSLGNSGSDDPDSDGASDRAEMQSATNPNSATSLFRLVSIAPESGFVELHFTSGPVRPQVIQWSDDLRQWQSATNPVVTYSSPWLSKSGANLAYPAPVYSVWQDTNSPGPRRFYRAATP